MKIENLITVLSVSRLKSFSEAAFELDYSQSSVSRQVKAIEDELGVRLFDRSPTSPTISLTDDGKRLLKPIQNVVDMYDDLMELVDVSKDKRIDFTLGLPQHIFPTSAQSTMQAFLYVSHPEIVLKTENCGFLKMSERILSRAFDAYLSYRVFPTSSAVPRFAYINDKLTVIPIARYDLHVCMSAEHPLAGRESVNISDLKNETFLVNPDSIASQDDAPHKCFLNLCAEANFTPKILPIERSYKDTKLLLAYTGKGVFMSFTPFGLFADPRIRSIPVTGAPFYSQYFMTYDPKRSKTKIVNTMADIFKGMIEADGFLG